MALDDPLNHLALCWMVANLSLEYCTPGIDQGITDMRSPHIASLCGSACILNHTTRDIEFTHPTAARELFNGVAVVIRPPFRTCGQTAGCPCRVRDGRFFCGA